MKETKEARFVRVGEKRVQNLINGIRSLSQLANKKVYQWTDDQIERIFKALEEELQECRVKFDNPETGVFKL